MFGINDDKATQAQPDDQPDGSEIDKHMDTLATERDISSPDPTAKAYHISEPGGAALPSSDDSPSTDVPPPNAPSDDLLTLKQQALQSLAPLVNHLEQTPEEKFKTTMMLLQASDNPSLVHEAYEAANQITDEKKRAQALLDVVNEINYFTQRQDQDDQN